MFEKIKSFFTGKKPDGADSGKKKKDKKDMTLKEKIVDNIKVFFSAYLIAFVIRLFLIEAYQIPSQSMVPNLMVQDILMVEKFSYGSILPIAHLKLPSIFKPAAGDIIVFVSPEWTSPGWGQELITLLTLSLVNLDNTAENPKNLVKRLIGMPGDKIMMTNRQLFINGQPVGTAYITNLSQITYNNFNQSGINFFDLYEEKFNGRTRVIQYLHFENNYFSPASSLHLDVRKSFPEIVVPQKDVQIVLTNINAYYKELVLMLIERETGKDVIEGVDGTLYLDGAILTSYTPKENYYFGMGDNRDNSQDCRYFGFIPEQNIFGRILFRYFPFNRLAFNADESAKSVLNVKFNK